MRPNERVANLGAASMEDDILIGNIAQLNDIDLEVKYHGSKISPGISKCYYQSNSFFK